MRLIPIAVFSVAALMLGNVAAAEQPSLHCGPFTDAALAAPVPRVEAPQARRFTHIATEVAAHPYRVLFLGDSLTERWDDVAADKALWDRYFAPLDALNAGVNGDRTEHLLWRLQHGDLADQQPRAAVLLIGTNDLGHGRPPDVAAEGVRRIVLYLRRALPRMRILLEGLWPRSDRARLGAEIAPVNRLLRQCADGASVVNAEPGQRLLDAQGRLPRPLAPDGLHPSPQGYQIVSPAIASALAPLLAGD